MESEATILTFKDVKEPLDAGFLTPQKAFLFTQNGIYEADLLTKNIEPLPATITRPLAITLDANNTPLFLLKEGKKFYLATYRPEQKSITKEVIDWPLQDSSIKDIAYYSGNIYILDNQPAENQPAENKTKQILKYVRNDFLRPRFWLEDKAKSSLDNPVSLASDGSIYILDLPSNIIEFRLGKKIREFSFSEKFSPLAKLRILGKDYLYLVDPQKNLFLLIDKKQGNTVKSDTLPSLGKILPSSSGEILDILPSQESQELMILTKNGVVKKPYILPK